MTETKVEMKQKPRKERAIKEEREVEIGRERGERERE